VARHDHPFADQPVVADPRRDRYLPRRAEFRVASRIARGFAEIDQLAAISENDSGLLDRRCAHPASLGSTSCSVIPEFTVNDDTLVVAQTFTLLEP
jgi:hypothetical protein